MKVCAIIAAGGLGERIGGDLPKQFQNLGNKPILVHTLEKFEICSGIDEILLVVPEDYLGYCLDSILERYNFQKIKKVIGGGKKRQDSVYKGLKAISPNTEIVIVHDGVRPFISPERISQSVDSCGKEKAVILAVPVKDTIKRVEDGVVFTTLNRENLFMVQTPQTFQYKLLLEAYRKAEKERFWGTDDSSLVERLGVKVKILEGDDNNIKITTQEDLKIAEEILKMSS